jgi:hypothetical protein
MNPPNARARVRNESNTRWIARLDALWAPLLNFDMLFLSAGTQRENATNGVVCREGGCVHRRSGARPGGLLDYALGLGACPA